MISVGILILMYLGYLIFKDLNLRRRYRLAFDGEVYVGQELNPPCVRLVVA
jgi:hypothetical protein